MTLLSRRIECGEEIFTRIHTEKPKYNSMTTRYDYYRDDSVSEAHIRRENWEAFRRIIKGLKAMDYEAKNGFRFLSKIEQIEIIKKRKEQAELVLRTGSFYPDEISEYREKVKQKVERVYEPYIKWKRKNLAIN